MIAILVQSIACFHILLDLEDHLRFLQHNYSRPLSLNLLPQMVFGNMNFSTHFHVRMGVWESTPYFGRQQFDFLNGQRGEFYLITPDDERNGQIYFQMLDPRYVDEKYILSEAVIPHWESTGDWPEFMGNININYSAHYKFQPNYIRNCQAQLAFTVQEPILQFKMRSDECVLDIIGRVDLSSFQHRSQTIVFCLTFLMLGLAKILTAFSLRARVSSQAFAARISLVFLCLLIYNDIISFVMLCYMTLLNNSNFVIYLPILLLWFILIFTVEMGVVKAVREAQFYEQLSFFYYFNFMLFVYAVTLFYCFTYPLFSFVCTCVPISQIWHNAKRGSTCHIINQLISLNVLRILEMLYIKGCPSNIFKYQPNPWLCFTVFVTQLSLFLLIYLQQLYGPRFFMPRVNFPEKYDYFKQSLIQMDDICPICHDPLDSHSTIGEVLKTPCSHYFHLRCLESWMRKKRECPNCRVSLPQF